MTAYADDKRTSFSSSGITPGTLSYTLPTLKQFEPGAGHYDDASGNTVAIADTTKDTNGLALFKDQWRVPTNFNNVYTRLTDPEQSNAYTTKLINQLLGKDPYIDKDHTGFLVRVINSIHADLRESIKAKNGGTLSPDAFYTYLLPVNHKTIEGSHDYDPNAKSEPMVEWALVITPLYRFECQAPFYCDNKSSGDTVRTNSGLKYVGGYDCVALDAYWFAQYDVTSIALGHAGLFPGTFNSSMVFNGKGMLSRWLSNTVGKPQAPGAVGAAAYCTQKDENNQDIDHYLGVYTNKGITSQYAWYQQLLSNPSEYAKRGGISVFTTKIEAPTPKIYYHLYTYELDEQNPPAGYTVGTTYAPKDLLQFTPNLGTPTVTSFSRDYAPTDSELYYIPASDPKATENNNVPVAANDKLLTGKGTCQISLVSYQQLVDTNYPYKNSISKTRSAFNTQSGFLFITGCLRSSVMFYISFH